MISQQFSLQVLAAALLALSSTVSSHMVMLTPVPYGNSTLTNAPILPDGSDFPCKQRSGVYDLEGASNVMAVGSTNTLSFMGSAVHGGGSCQVSLTTDKAPTINSKWMVIHSIIGNCPSDARGNLEGGPNVLGAKKFQYTIPNGITPGDYTIAWTWVNKVGNREFYMNCGPATITAPKKKRYAPEPKMDKRAASFPDMFLANMPNLGTCKTLETFDTVYPNPGASVEYGTVGVDPSNTPLNTTAGECAAAVAGQGGNSSSSPSPAAGGVPAASSATGGGFASGTGAASPAATGAPTAPAPAATSTAVVSPIPAASPVSSAAPVASPASSAAPAAPTGGATGAVLSGPCSPEGQWSCAANGASFQRCASGSWSASIPMAAGTTCTPGVSTNLNMVAAKRSSPHARRSLLFGRTDNQ